MNDELVYYNRLADCKITESEKQAVLIAHVNDRPNSSSAFGKSKLNSTDTKKLFDKQFLLMSERHNDLSEVVGDLIGELLERIVAESKDLDDAVRSLSERIDDLSYELTDDDKREISEIATKGLSDQFAAALDEIILVQNTLMGKKISFTIESRDDGVKTYEAIDGMTWGKWIDSDYNTFGATSGNMVGDYVGSVYKGIQGVYLNGDIARVTDVIVADAEYYFL